LRRQLLLRSGRRVSPAGVRGPPGEPIGAKPYAYAHALPLATPAPRATNRDGQHIALQTIVLGLVSIRHVHSMEMAMLEYLPAASDRNCGSCIHQRAHLTRLDENPTPTVKSRINAFAPRCCKCGNDMKVRSFASGKRQDLVGYSCETCGKFKTCIVPH
jgi:hypothetical protein